MGHYNDGTVCIDWADTYRVRALGRWWYFDWSHGGWGGPMWLRKDGEPRTRNVPAKAWDAFERWLKRNPEKHSKS